LNIGGAKVALVSEVLDRLLDEFGGESARRSVLFQAALQICADESRRVKHGEPAAPLEVLVERARTLLNAPPGQPLPDTATAAASAAAPPEQAEFPSMPLEEPTAPLPEEEPPAGAVPDFYADETVGEEVGRRHRRLPAPLLLGVLALLAMAAGTYFVYSRYETGSSEATPPRITESYPPPNRAPVETPRPAGEEARVPAVARTAAAPAPAPTVPPPAPVPNLALPEPVEPRASGAPARVVRPPARARWEGVEVMVSPDWAGRAPIYVIHFSSYREREKAERDAVQVGRRFGRPAYAARITLPSGVWYRVVLGDFATGDQARAFHADLAARGTPDLGAVYRITAP
jgi:hypothetical protein